MSEIGSKTFTGPYAKCPLFLPDFNGTCIFSTDFRKIRLVSNFMEIRPVGNELFHADGRTGGRTDGRADGRADGRTDEQTRRIK